MYHHIPVWVLVCFWRSPDVLKDLQQFSSWHLYGFSPVCVREWLFSPYPEIINNHNYCCRIRCYASQLSSNQHIPVANFFPQPGNSQTYGLSPVWERSCTCEGSNNSEFANVAENDIVGSLGLPCHADLEMVGSGVELSTAFIFTAERLLANIRAPRLPVVLIL